MLLPLPFLRDEDQLGAENQAPAAAAPNPK